MIKRLLILAALVGLSGPAWGQSAAILIQSHTTGAAAGGGGGGANMTDTFTEASDTTLASHTGDGGQTWTKRDGSSNAVGVTGATDNISVSGSGTDNFGYYSSYTPADADYCVEGNIKTSTTGKTSLWISLRNPTGTQDGYMLGYEGGAGWKIKRISGSTQIGSTYNADDPTTVRSVRLCASGTSLTGYIAGVSRITGTDGNVSAAGRPGVYSEFSDIGTSETLDDFKEYETVAAP